MMIEAVKLTTFNKNRFSSLKTENNFASKNQNNITLPSLETGLALKNQVLFKGNIQNQQRKELIKETIEKNSLPIKPQALEFVLSNTNNESELYTKYSKTGSKFFELFSRYTLHKEHPIKDEGELTDIITIFIKSDNKSKIINDIIPESLLPKTGNKQTTQGVQANCLNAFLGAVIYENKDGFKTAFNFLDKTVGKNIYPKNITLEKSPFENLANIVEKKGHSWQDLYQETRFFNEQWHYRIHYKDLILSEAKGDRHSHEIREQCINEAAEKIESNSVNLDAAGNNLIYTNYKKPTSQRIKELEDFCQKWGLKFNDITILHKAFLYGEMQDGSALAHCDTYETLEYVGDAALGFCTHEILQDNLINSPRKVICAKRHSFVKNKNLAILAEKMKLAEYTINRDKSMGEKRTADMFEALIGAIFIDGKENGINNVYEFLDKNFRDEICNSAC